MNISAHFTTKSRFSKALKFATTTLLISCLLATHPSVVLFASSLPPAESQASQPHTPPLQPELTNTHTTCTPEQPSLLGSIVTKVISWFHTTIQHAKQTITQLFTSTGSSLIRSVAAFLLGILLSLTPCIYPMIPITIGVLQASGSSRPYKNFLLALCYTLGISITFALLGFIAAIGSCVFGEMQGSPWVIIPISLILIYFAFSMFDWIHLYIPRFLQPKANKVKGGSLLSAFAFGALSGTIASPCLSPGLVLILNYVTQISASHFSGYIEGFLLLFLFGIGSSLPLLIIGTFSGSMHFLPKAGAWMVEIKKLVGIMLICMAFYQLSHLERLLPWYLFVWVIVLSFVALGVYYFASVSASDKKGMRRYKNFMGTVLIVIACLMMVQGQKAVFDHWYPVRIESAWGHDYDAAYEKAKHENKLLFVDIGATYCASCKSMDEKIFANDKIKQALTSFVQLKIEADIHKESYEALKKGYGMYIEGYPTYLVIDPKSNTVVKKWSIELDQLSIDAIVDELAKLREFSVVKQ